MTKTTIRFKAKLLRPAESEKGDSWTFLILPKNASAKLPSRGHDRDRRHHQWLPFSSRARAGRPKESLAQSGPEATQICGRRGRRHRHARDRARVRGTGTHGAGRSEKSSRGRRTEGEKIVVGHHAHRAPGLDPLDHFRQAGRDTRAPDQKCLLDARRREAPPLLLRPVWVLQQKLERSQSGDLDEHPFAALNRTRTKSHLTRAVLAQPAPRTSNWRRFSPGGKHAPALEKIDAEIDAGKFRPLP